jgi:aryl-alcohol dehydrogenase-like predicted oxidoreductase
MPDAQQDITAAAAGTFSIAGELPVNRLGFGAMRITGEGIWGEPADPDECRAVLRRAVELDINFIDTADSYGPDVSERLIGETLAPYPEDLTVATKAGLTRPGPNDWRPDGRPEHIREACEGSLKRLKLDQIPLYQLHRIDSKVPMEDQLGTLRELRDEGKIRFIGLSEISVEDLRAAQEHVPVASVQNRYNLTDRGAEELVGVCEEEGIGFIPWFPLATGELARQGGPLDEIASAHDAAPSQVALAWLLQHSSTMLPIPGTSTVEHLEQNVIGAGLELSAYEVKTLDALA